MTKLSVAGTERSPIMHEFLAAKAMVDGAKGWNGAGED
jgi:hypothetical protein